MNERDFIEYKVDEYIENEIDYIKSDIQHCGANSGLLRDLNMLENMSDEAKENIVLNILNDDELFNKLYESIHYYLYH